MGAPQAELIVRHEPVMPWLAASILTIAAYVGGVVVGTAPTINQKVVLTVGLCSVVTATELVLTRSRRVQEALRRDERTRPAADELRAATPLAHAREHDQLPPYAAGMLRYTAAVVELLEHSIGVALDRGADPTELASARDDAAALHDLLTAMAREPVHLRKAAKVHTICSLWETEQARIQQLAADLDPDFHRHWRARHVAALRLRHGAAPRRTEPELPYRAATTED